MFRTTDGVSVPAVTEAEMAEVDRIAIEETGPNLFQMMENAGRNLALTAADLLGPSPGSVVILAGTGGNGGGGITAARHLANHGYEVAVGITAADRLGEVPAVQARLYSNTPGRIMPLDEAPAPALIVDAILGYSLRGAPRGAALDLIGWANAQDAPVLSLDIPSGLDATTGEAEGDHITATSTRTLALPKSGLVSAAAGDLVLGDIGIPAETYRRLGVPLGQSPFGPGFRVGLIRP